MRESIAPIRRAGSGTNELDLRERSCHSAVQPRAQKSLGGLTFHSRLRTRIYETGLRLARSAARCFLSHGAFFWCPLPLRGGPRRARTPHVGAMQALLLAYSSLPTWYAQVAGGSQP